MLPPCLPLSLPPPPPSLAHSNPTLEPPPARAQTLLAYDARTGALLPGQAPAPKRVVEHVVFERRLWYDLPWVAKDRLFADA